MADMETKCPVCEECFRAFDTQMDFEVHLCCQTRKCPMLCISEGCRGNYHCCICGKKFVCFSAMEIHKNAHSGEKPFVCLHCPFRSTTSYNLSAHIARKHSKTFKHYCSFCSKGFLRKSELERHIQITHPSEETDESIVVKKEKGEAGENQNQSDLLHRCNHCTYTSKIKTNLIRHLWTHSDNRPYQCEICYKGYLEKGQLRDHLRTHTGERPFVCNTCRRGFRTKKTLQTHERLHPEEKMYLRDPSKSRVKEPTKPSVKMRSVFPCKLCRRPFRSEGRLIVHLRVHTNDRPFVCDACPKKYTTKMALTKHKLVHSVTKKEVMHRCPICPFSADREHSIRVHLQSHSPSETAVPIDRCKLCNRVVNNMEKHLENCKGRKKVFQCKFCYGHFTKKKLMEHQSVCKEKHPFTCSTCGRGFYTLSYLKFHESLHPTSLSQERPLVKEEPQNPAKLPIFDSKPKQALVLPKPAIFQPAPIQNQLIILQPTIILNGS